MNHRHNLSPIALFSPEEIKADPVWQALNPHGKRFLESRLLPPLLNPFSKKGIEMYALVLVGIPHSKAIPAHAMLWSDYVNGVYDGKHTLVVPSSGNTVHAVARLARAYGLRVKAVMSTDVPDTKTGILRALGTTVDVLQVGDVAATTEEEASRPGHHHLDQYAHPANPGSHKQYTGPEILRLFGGNPLGAIAVALGSGGTAYGIAQCFSRRSPNTAVLGVRPALGQQVPGARDENKMNAVVKFEWQESVRTVEEVSRKESFIAMRRLWSAVEPQPGPTSGMAYAGLLQYLSGLSPERLAWYRGKSVAFFCPDDGRFYTAPTLAELDPDQGVI